MFQWYRNSTVCYAYIKDYSSGTFDAESLAKSEWLYRGWTLQELIAPREVVFYNRYWQPFGSKTDRDVCEAVSDITKIDVEFLLGSDLESASIAKRMSWASRRKTTRIEDTAYCLMGLFDINMPLLYGEGPKAFRRLQQEIMKEYPEDHSLYAWGIPVDKCSVEVTQPDAVIRESIDDPLASSEPLFGLLAKSPQDFEYSRSYSPISNAHKFYSNFWVGWKSATYPTSIGKGIRIELLASSNFFHYQFSEPSVSISQPGEYAFLLCKDDTDEDVTPCIPLLDLSSGYYSRFKELYLNRILRLSQTHFAGLANMRRTMIVAAERKPELRNGDIIIRSIFYRYSINYTTSFNTADGVFHSYSRLFRLKCDLAIHSVLTTFQGGPDISDNWGIMLGRIRTNDYDFPAFQAGIIALCGPDIDIFREEFVCEKVFQSPSDEATFDLDNFLQVAIRVNRRPLSDESGFIDIVDISVRDALIEEDESIEEENDNMAETT
ncbi:hypothetical protein Hte_007743 [Hypoxylon texense]